MGNLCVDCHSKSKDKAIARFNLGTASNALGNNPNPASGSGAETSHFWGGNSTLQPAAGSTHPPTTFYTSRYSTSKNRITCTICHDPHGQAGTKLVRAAIAGDLICQQCHSQWFVANPEAELTHPIVANYAAIAAANPTKYKATVSNVGNGGVRLVNGGVSCTSCHGTHYADSTSSTVDSTATYNDLTMAKGDGKILRSDGALRVGGTRNGINGTAQLRSNLCQSCHTYKMHGKGLTGDVQIGCLECHEAHSSNAYTLRDVTPTAVPKRANLANIAAAVVTFSPYPAGGNVRTKWSDDTLGTATGYCEVCHGDVQDPAAIGGQELEHLVGGINPCTACHKHNDPANIHSFNIDANAATCGQCHGFPPYLNAAGDRDTGGTDGGYARNEVDGAPYDYTGSSHFMDESTTAHKTHAGADLPTNPGTWYFVGNAGIENCMPCHGNSAGSTGGGHRIAPSTDANTFRNVNFNQFGTGNGHYAPTYNTTTNQCSSTYCHGNGAPRTSDSTRDYSVVVNTPAWVGNGTTDGFNSIQGKGTRCQFCHGNTEATMGVAQKKNSPAHLVHLNKGYGCEVCHIDTALNSSTLEPNATNGRTGGEHINLIADVSYKTSGTPLSVAMATNLNGPLYNTTTGTCSIYCHDPNDTGNTADWDDAANMQCDSCHKGLLTDTSADGGLGPITSGSHLRHVSDATGPKLGCDECHGAGSSTGSHSGMLDGVVVVVAGVCNTCHAVDAGETVPVWGSPATGGCIACHTGATTTPGGLFTTAAAPAFPNFLSTGHGKPSGTYATTNLPAANKACLDCHAAASANHYDNIAGNDDVLIGGFSCEGCHNGTSATAVKTHSNTDPAYTGQKRADFTKLCLGCHTPHGSANLAMIAPIKPDFGGTVVFTSFGNVTPVANDNSFDESGDSPLSNLDDICATCHTTTTHNNRAMAGAHQEGKTCTACHSHNGAYGGFMPTGGTACNDCHGNPPATGAHGKHTTVSGHTTAEDLSDCANCHTGAETYTYGPGGNHQNTVVNVAVGWNNNGTPANKNDDTCATACHVAIAGDGFWGDANGLNCDSCHYYAASPVSGNNLSDVHDEHFAKSKPCSACHNMAGSEYNNGTAIIGPLLHINNRSGANEGAKFTGMAQALMDEAGFDEGAGVRDVVRSGMTYTDANTCSGGIGLGCHATGTPDWDVIIPNDATGCIQCHTDTTTSAVNPTSSLHAVVPTVSGKQHSTGFTYNGGVSTANCTTCHTTTPSTLHQNGVLNATIGAAGNTAINFAAGVGFTDAVTPTCAVSTTGCHSRGNGWSYKWHNNAAATNGTECNGCHGMWAAWNTGVINHRSGSESETVHGTGAVYKCRDCHGLESVSGYPFTTTTNDWKPTEAGTTLHGDGLININIAGTTGYTRSTFGGCTGCHSANDGAAAGQHGFAISTWTLNTISSTAITSSCSSCHGGATTGVSTSNYWPDGANTLGDNGTADNSGAHAVHMARLALKVYGETATGAADNDVLRNATTLNPGLTSDAKQKELCSYCHNTPGTDGDHGVTYPADVNSMYTMWSKTLDNGVLTPATGSCATVDCHNNVTTAAGYYWYAGGASACAMCHSPYGATDTTHTAHTANAMGMVIDCLKCHGAGTTTTTAPTTGHINGTLTVAGNVPFTYSGGLTGTCGTNLCHTSGRYVSGVLQAPKTASYPWGTPIAGCDACHETTSALNSGSHTAHMTTTSQAMTCNSCHTAATVATHIDAAINFTGAAASYNTSLPEPMSAETFSTCGTNLCHNNGKNAAPYNNGLGSYTWNTAIGAVNSCTECHNNAALGELHSNHTGAATLFGITTVTCDSCHGAGAAAGTHSGHVTATVTLVAGMNYSGTNSTNVTLNTFGTCNTTTCHNNGLGAAVLTPAWNDPSSTADDCTLCHGNAGANLTSKAHPIHIATAAQSGKAWGPYPTAGSSNCGECHASPANNTSMAGYATHIDGTNNFVGGGNLAATAACNTCHGGATAAATAKGYWTTTPTRVTCESCHGQYSAAVINTKSAPLNAGASYTTYGHNKVTNSAFGGKACGDCHDNTAAGHIDGVSNDDKRMKVVNGQTYAVANNTFCASACHSGAAENAHYANTQTAGGASDDGIYCMTCHNPHGQNGNQDAMIRSTIAGRAVAGFADKTLRSSYANASFNGVCQVCHDTAGEVPYFNRNTFLPGHQGGVDVCTTCHSHSSTTAFAYSGGGCGSCHGYPPVQRLTGAGASYPYAKVEDYPGGGRAHAVAGHLATSITPADGWAPCQPCHTESDHNMGLGVGNLQTQRDISGNWTNEATRYPRVNMSTTFDKGGTAFYNMSTRNTTAGMGNCANTSCHFSESPKWDCLPADTTNDPQ